MIGFYASITYGCRLIIFHLLYKTEFMGIFFVGIATLICINWSLIHAMHEIVK